MFHKLGVYAALMCTIANHPMDTKETSFQGQH